MNNAVLKYGVLGFGAFAAVPLDNISRPVIFKIE
jgi:hypothetical protein